LSTTTWDGSRAVSAACQFAALPISIEPARNPAGAAAAVHGAGGL
jgi:hypothetical protein